MSPAERIEDIIKSAVPLYGHMDLKLAIEGERFEVHVPFEDRLKSHVDTLHPAFQWAAGELLGGIVVIHTFGKLDGLFLVVREVNIKLERPAKGPLVASARFSPEQAEALRAAVAEGEGSFELQAELRCGEETVARLTGDYLVRQRR